MEWTETIVVTRPLEQVRDAIADENQLMAWSAWPKATGFSCAVEGDGTSIGSAITFRDRAGVVQGRQRLTRIETDRVEYRLRNRGPGGREMTPELDFRLTPVDDTHTRVHLDFRATAPLPPGLRQLAELVLGRRVRRLHIQDLEQLKAHVENDRGSRPTR
ncbi:SRPBCC family protein [Mycobacterium manitobense]|uniref:SRPBCC family protein n=1 Tax=[Mycobacterium] manitobense TaxID=190147 RepID=A0A9X3BVG1_9MYCO|nr:SRPBCC family protein [[Mycobacterium] manitobense]MCV7169232.1 SRPBCC family protein [[Mycobacterium] manitobense]